MTKEALSIYDTLTLALEALENLINQHYAETTTNDDLEMADKAITAIKEVLAQPEQEPEAWYHPENDRTYFTAYPDKNMIKNGYWQPLYKKGKL